MNHRAPSELASFSPQHGWLLQPRRSGFSIEVESLISKDISFVTKDYVTARLEAAAASRLPDRPVCLRPPHSLVAGSQDSPRFSGISNGNYCNLQNMSYHQRPERLRIMSIQRSLS